MKTVEWRGMEFEVHDDWRVVTVNWFRAITVCQFRIEVQCDPISLHWGAVFLGRKLFFSELQARILLAEPPAVAGDYVLRHQGESLPSY